MTTRPSVRDCSRIASTTTTIAATMPARASQCRTNLFERTDDERGQQRERHERHGTQPHREALTVGDIEPLQADHEREHHDHPRGDTVTRDRRDAPPARQAHLQN
jgi:hypothetical protein